MIEIAGFNLCINIAENIVIHLSISGDPTLILEANGHRYIGVIILSLHIFIF
jgi:hypothetical protein